MRKGGWGQKHIYPDSGGSEEYLYKELDITLTKASLPSRAWAEFRGLFTVSLAVVTARSVKPFSSALGST